MLRLLQSDVALVTLCCFSRRHILQDNPVQPADIPPVHHPVHGGKRGRAGHGAAPPSSYPSRCTGTSTHTATVLKKIYFCQRFVADQ
jgi:hypothetical protein